jgi:hypothetical protein
MRIRLILSDFLVGIPGGFLIFMGLLLFSTLLGRLTAIQTWMVVLTLIFTAWIVGLLAGWFRKEREVETAAAAGIICALILVIVRQISPPGPEMGLVFGTTGWVFAIIFCTLGGWCMKGWKK